MKILRNIVLGVAALFVLLIAVAALLFGLIFDPNDYRDNIATAVQERTGRSLDIEGELDVQYFPWVGFDVGRTTLGEDPSFGEQPFVSLDKASVRVKLLPLLTRRLEIGQVTVDGLEVNLIRNEAGVDNWQSLLDRLGATEDAAAEAPAAEGGAGLTSESIGGVAVSKSGVTFDDRQAGTRTTLANFELETGRIAQGDPVRIATGFDVAVSDGGLTARVEIDGEAQRDGDRFTVVQPTVEVTGRNDPSTGSVPFADFALSLSAPSLASDGERHEMSAPRLTFAGSGGADGLSSVDVDVSADGLTGSTEALRLEAPAVELTVNAEGLPADTPVRMRANHLAASLAAQTLELADYALEVLDLRAGGSLTGKNIVDDPELRGPLRIESFSPRALLGKLDVPVETADPAALSSLAGSANLILSSNAQRVDGIDLRLDDSRIRGLVAISNAATGAKAIELEIDAIDADRYLAPAAAPAEGDGSAADALEIPAQTLRDLNVRGSLKIGRLLFSGIESSNVEVGLNAANGKIRVHPSKASLYGGDYSGDIRVDATGELPVLSINETVSNIDFGAFAGTVMEDNPLSGRLTGQVALEGRGHNTAQIRETLNGRTSFDFTDGVVEGIDVMEVLNGIVAIANRRIPQQTSGPRRTEFRKLAGDATVTDGVLRTDNLTVAAAALRITGSGTVDLNTRAVDFGIESEVVESDGVELSPELARAVGYKIPVYIGGTYDAPSATGLERSAASLVKQYGAKKLLGRLFDDDEEQAETADGVAPEDEEPKDIEDELEDKAKGLLKDLLGGGG